MKKISVILYLLFVVNICLAQDSSATKKISWGVIAGASLFQMDFNNLNSNGYLLGEPKNNELLFPCISFTVGNKNKFFASLDYYFNFKTTTGSFNTYKTIEVTKINTRYGITVYYALLNKNKITLCLTSGVSMAQAYINSENKGGTNSIDTITTFENSKIKQNFLVNAGLTFDVAVKKMLGSIMYLGLKAGYNFSTSQPSWYSGSTKENNKPDVNLGGAYVALTLNVWADRKKK